MTDENNDEINDIEDDIEEALLNEDYHIALNITEDNYDALQKRYVYLMGLARTADATFQHVSNLNERQALFNSRRLVLEQAHELGDLLDNVVARRLRILGNELPS